MSIRVEKNKYLNTWGVQPRGQGMWTFKIKNQDYTFKGTYAECKAKAIRKATALGAFEVIVMPQNL